MSASDNAARLPGCAGHVVLRGGQRGARVGVGRQPALGAVWGLRTTAVTSSEQPDGLQGDGRHQQACWLAGSPIAAAALAWGLRQGSISRSSSARYKPLLYANCCSVRQ